MGKDPELDRLKEAQNLAYNRKQSAYDAQQSAWQHKKAAGDDMHAAFEDKDRAYHAQQDSWDQLQRLRDNYGPRIEQLNRLQEAEFQSMKSSYDSASAAHDRRDGASAKAYADQGRVHKANSQGYVQERRQLVDELRSAGDRHKLLVEPFRTAKATFDAAKREFDAAKAVHEQAQKTFKDAKEAFDKAASAFRERLEKVKAENSRKRSDKRTIAQKAGVPYSYLDNVWVSKGQNGSTNIYFGGVGTPNGPGHGHYVIDRDDKVTYKRDPFDAHGAQNYADAKNDYTEVIGGELARGGDVGFICRFRGYTAHVETNVNAQGRAKIDIYYGPNGPFGPGHHHAVAYRETPYDFVSDEIR